MKILNEIISTLVMLATSYSWGYLTTLLPLPLFVNVLIMIPGAMAIGWYWRSHIWPVITGIFK